MDDFVIPSLKESRTEWAARLINILSPPIVEGINSIFDDSMKLCKENNEMEKYLMTFQNFISRVPKWNEFIIETETKRILEKTQCKYLEDLITCVHIIQLKLLSAVRVGSKQKKIEINIPKINDFIHRVYVYVARKVYKNAYLFETNISPLQKQKNNANFERIVNESILNTIRDNIPVEDILKAYMAESIEDEIVEEIKTELVDGSSTTEASTPAPAPAPAPITPPAVVEQQNTIVSETKTTAPEMTIPKLEPFVDNVLPNEVSKQPSVTFDNTQYFRDQNNKDTNTEIFRGPKISEEPASLDLGIIDLNSTNSKTDNILLNDIEVLN